MRSDSYIPRDNDDMARYYFTGASCLAAQIARTMLPYSSDDDRADVVQDAAMRAIRFDIVGKFDATKGNFGGLVYATVRTVVTSYLRHRSADPLGALNAGSLTTTSGDSEDSEIGEYSLDRIFSGDTSIEDKASASETLSRLWDRVNKLAVRPANRRERSLRSLFLLLAEGRTPRECADTLGVTQVTIGNWTRYMGELAR